MKARDLMFVLPNAFTVSSIFCGFHAATLVANNPGPEQFYQAAIDIFFAFFFDGLDGRVARATKTQSDFGVQLDSLADVCSFGMAPALLVYQWALKPLGFWGMFIAFAFASCGALRLARFNVLAARKVPGSGSYFVGLPIPLAAGVLISLIITDHATGANLAQTAPWGIAGLTVVLSALMVSTIQYRTFKDVKPGKRSLGVVMGLAVFGLAVAVQLRPEFVPVAFFSAYLLMGLVQATVGLLKRPVPPPPTDAATPGGPQAPAGDPDAEADDEDEPEHRDQLVKP